ncbi:hypothetical protein E2C01_005576 [Portunus trituberculatus]|uniref:Uncharacterized protein n=1 Tax=Portunus trituberculatus TaxID=210409 RepID=A0A5B7CVH1_PORTR|nr:hypothetical protein [Portunus trituberculatus]
MPLLPVRWGVLTVMVVEGIVVEGMGTTTTLAAPNAPHSTLCPNVTTNQLDFVNNTDGCVTSAYKHSEPQENNRTKLKSIHYHDIFCINRLCPARLTSHLYNEGGGCVVPNDFLEGLMKKNAPYIFCGRFIGNNYEEMALTAVPVSYNSDLENALYNKYGNIPCQ